MYKVHRLRVQANRRLGVLQAENGVPAAALQVGAVQSVCGFLRMIAAGAVVFNTLAQ